MQPAQETGNLKYPSKRDNKTFFVGISLAMSALVMCLAVPVPPGWSAAELRALGVLVFALVLWATEALESTVTGLAVLIALPVLKIIPYADSIAGMGTPIIWRLVGIFVFTGAVQKSGLDKRISYQVLRLARGNVKTFFFLVLMTSFLFIFLVPAAMGRTVLISTMVLGLLSSMNIKPPSNLGKSIFLALPMVSLISSTSVIVGASTEIYAAGLFQTVLGFEWTYMSWLITNLPIGLITIILMYPIFLRLFPPEMTNFPGGQEFLKGALRGLGPLTIDEKKVLVTFSVLLVLWLADVSDFFPAELLAAVILMVPGPGVFTWKEASQHINWGTLILFGSGLALAKAMLMTGVVDHISRLLMQVLGGLSPIALAAVVFFLTTVVRLGMSNMMGVVATLLPLVLAFAGKAGVNPVWLGMICVIASASGFFCRPNRREQSTHMPMATTPPKTCLRLEFGWC
ncbi:Sodium/sulphate symporter [Moorella glycerini]|uniref:Sodium-dependent dicarboxylate transporter SdcS n=1 Tax=Neomoorella stamsii TaxID=1266720 RepID=A0A9X7J3H7_9FIRM|nr:MULTISPECIES: SLC13 family permease [Moorella]PRR73580.1 Sodium-dependent dicarboxylate transporter SdcS [Moorella stamsii]CEP69349.1 Sodium/sulphate symporter [Moorella glycerini]